jgi:hypothetical protein
MAPIQAYHRPETIAEALELLNRNGVRTALLGGGTTIVAELAEQEIEEVVDLQDAGPAHVERAAAGWRWAPSCACRRWSMTSACHPSFATPPSARAPTPSATRARSAGSSPAAIGKASCSPPCLCTMPASPWKRPPARRYLPRRFSCRAGAQRHYRRGHGRNGRRDRPGTRGPHAAGHSHRRRPGPPRRERRRPAGPDRRRQHAIPRRPRSKLDTLDPPGDFRGSSDYRKEIAAILARRALAELEE